MKNAATEKKKLDRHTLKAIGASAQAIYDKAMRKSKIEKRSKVKPFIKVMNYNHVMPTRYTVDFDLKKAVEETGGIDPAKVKDTRKGLKKIFEDKYKNQTAKNDKKSVGMGYFFTKLRF